MRHQDLPGAGRATRREIDARLPTIAEKQALRNPVQHAELELVADGHTGFDQDSSWRIRIDGSGALVIDVRDRGAWVEQASWTA